MNWADFQPLVMPYVTGASIPLLELHARQAATEFCDKTKCWIQTLEPIMGGGFADVDLEPDLPGAVIFDMQNVSVDGKQWTIAPPDTGLRLISNGSRDAFCFTQDMRVLTFSPMLQTGSVVVVTVAMKPSPAAKKLDVGLVQYADSIAHGAVASLLRAPGVSGSDSGWHEAMFRDKIKTESARLARAGIANGGQRPLPSFF